MAAPERPNDEIIGHFTLTVPSNPLESDYVGSRSALFVPTEELSGVGFFPSEINDVVVITKDVAGLLDTISEKRQFGWRGKPTELDGGLESDYDRQQMIVYSFVTSGDSVLIYERPRSSDSRLAGKASMGFGGHTETSDRTDIAQFGAEPSDDREFTSHGVEDGSLSKGINREIEEELGIQPHQADLKIIGAFREVHPQESLQDRTKLPVGTVHTCIIAIADLSPDVAEITLQDDEVGYAKWIKIKDIKPTLQLIELSDIVVEDWTKIGTSEFADILDELGKREPQKLPEIRIN